MACQELIAEHDKVCAAAEQIVEQLRDQHSFRIRLGTPDVDALPRTEEADAPALKDDSEKPAELADLLSWASVGGGQSKSQLATPST